MSRAHRLLPAMVIAAGAAIGPQAHLMAAQAPAPEAPREPAGRGGRSLPGIAPAEIQRMLDGYELMQAHAMLELGDDQFPRFLPKLRALQDARRRGQVQRSRVLQDLRRMTQSRPAQDDARIKESIRTLDDLDARSAVDIRQARDAINQVLDAFQQAKFRLFEETMEQRKVELMMRARQANRQNRLQNPLQTPTVP